MARRIEIVEVGPRDGLQNEKRVLSVEDRVHFIGLLEAAGVRRIEAVSFVNPARVPQMAGAEEIMSLLPAPARGARRIGLVLNEKGWERCVAAGCDEANVVVCASDGFGIRNQGTDTDAQIETLARIMDRSRTEGPPVSATVSVAFGCPFDGEVPEARLTAIVRSMAQTGVEEIALADTIGVADPWTVRRRVEAAMAVAPDARLRLHFHDTRRTGLANAFAGVEAGVDVLDASCGGIGGCPFAPNATGNIATEDLVYMLERAGFDTGLDLDALIAAAHWVGEALGKLHLAGADFVGKRPNALSVQGWPPLLQAVGSRADEIMAGLGDVIAQELAHLEGVWPKGLPEGVIHADLFPDNVFFLSGQLSGLIDFYFACTDAFAYDLAICLNAWCFEQDASFNITKGMALLNGYERVRLLREDEVEALPTLARGAALRFLLTRSVDWLNRAPGALVMPKDPMEYLKKLRFHQRVEQARDYGLAR